MEAPDAIRRAALTHAAHLLIEVVREGAPTAAVEESISGGGVCVRVIVNGTGQADRQAPDAEQGGGIAESIRRVLRADGGPLKLVTIAHRADRDLTSHFRKVAYRMAAAGELVRREGHKYSLADRPR